MLEHPFSSKLTEEERQMLQAIQQSRRMVPQIGEACEPIQSLSHRHIKTPSIFPREKPYHLSTERMFKHFNLDVLFFIFYFESHTWAQYYAAKQLKQRGWTYHTKYHKWFQRHQLTSEEEAMFIDSLTKESEPLKKHYSDKDHSSSSSSSSSSLSPLHDPCYRPALPNHHPYAFATPPQPISKHNHNGHIAASAPFTFAPHKVEADCESGCYRYFDNETGWCQRVKPNFLFQYCWLQDEVPRHRNNVKHLTHEPNVDSKSSLGTIGEHFLLKRAQINATSAMDHRSDHNVLDKNKKDDTYSAERDDRHWKRSESDPQTAAHASRSHKFNPLPVPEVVSKDEWWELGDGPTADNAATPQSYKHKLHGTTEIRTSHANTETSIHSQKQLHADSAARRAAGGHDNRSSPQSGRFDIDKDTKTIKEFNSQLPAKNKTPHQPVYQQRRQHPPSSLSQLNPAQSFAKKFFFFFFGSI
ncbi:hypothetical protein RFI_18753 [Reticulomyxa filosa]|uniref:NOT2/NOT3/NOT5 C-terminal domain-containing protein n=1 Tax=Reticulomyxa filosa TaxID=46433 RepID=X6MYG0_RETFI|nr:hypothetical protein RFI_18753 [Reticulomyxa filosa]|eukprot:ETO18512.1 hypothetical protein RFI_18753 [Reticulomyxa filosa]